MGTHGDGDGAGHGSEVPLDKFRGRGDLEWQQKEMTLNMMKELQHECLAQWHRAGLVHIQYLGGVAVAVINTGVVTLV